MIIGLFDDRVNAVGGVHLPLDDTDTHLALIAILRARFVLVVDVASFKQRRVFERFAVTGQVLLQHFFDMAEMNMNKPWLITARA